MSKVPDRGIAPHQLARVRGTGSDLRSLREELEENRRFRVQQLGELADQRTTTATDGVVVEIPRTQGVQATLDIVDEWGRDSFPASDPPANW